MVSPKVQVAPTHSGWSTAWTLAVGAWARLVPVCVYGAVHCAHRYARDASLISTLYAHWGFTATDAECAHVFVADVSTAATRSPAIPVHVKAFYEPSAAHKA